METKTKARNIKTYPEVDYANYGSPNARSSKGNNLTTTPDVIQPIALEDAPVNTGRADTIALEVLRQRVAKTIDAGMEVGKAFPVPAKSRTSIYDFLKQKYPHMKFTMSYMKDAAFARFVRRA